MYCEKYMFLNTYVSVPLSIVKEITDATFNDLVSTFLVHTGTPPCMQIIFVIETSPKLSVGYSLMRKKATLYIAKTTVLRLL